MKNTTSSIQITPSSSIDLFNISFDKSCNTLVTIVVYDHIGRRKVIQNENISKLKPILNLDMSPLSPGMYLIKVTTEDGGFLVKGIIIK